MQGLAVIQESECPRRDGASTMRVPISSDVDIVVARQQGKTLARAMNFSPTDAAFIATTVSELARALLARTARGEIWLHRIDEPQRTGVVIIAHEPFMRTGPSVGPCRDISDLALPDVYRLVDEFHIDSEAGYGTTITATKWCRRH
jgi:serine/threonine-protein kinase RsbT